MKRLTLAAALAALSFSGCGQQQENPNEPASDQTNEVSAAETDQPKETEQEQEDQAMSGTPDYLVNVEGMSCGNCVKNVKLALEGFDGVDHADVDLESGIAKVYMNEGQELDSDAVTAAIDGRGFTTKSFAKAQ